jgi:hypothetical protein
MPIDRLRSLKRGEGKELYPGAREETIKGIEAYRAKKVKEIRRAYPPTARGALLLAYDRWSKARRKIASYLAARPPLLDSAAALEGEERLGEEIVRLLSGKDPRDFKYRREVRLKS